MLFTFSCPSCRKDLEADTSLSGSQLACPHCQAPVAVPEGKLGPGATLGDFRLERLLGKGGMGEVYLGTQLSVDRQVAVKTLPPPRQRNPHLSEGCGRLIERMMAKKPDERYVDWRALIADVDRVLAGDMPLEPAVSAGSSPDTANRAHDGRGVAGSRMNAALARQVQEAVARQHQTGAGAPSAHGAAALKLAASAWRSPWVWAMAAAAVVVVALAATLALRHRGGGRAVQVAERDRGDRTDRTDPTDPGPTGTAGAGAAPGTPPPGPGPTTPPAEEAAPTAPAAPATQSPAAVESIPATPPVAAPSTPTAPAPLPRAPEGFLYGYFVVSQSSIRSPREYLARVGAFTNVTALPGYGRDNEEMVRALAEADIGLIVSMWPDRMPSLPADLPNLLALWVADMNKSPRLVEPRILGMRRQYPGVPVLVTLDLRPESPLWREPDPVPSGTDFVAFWDYERAPEADVRPRILSDVGFLRRVAPGLPILVLGRAIRGEDRFRNPLSVEEARGWAGAALQAWRGKQDDLGKGLSPEARRTVTAQLEAVAGMDRQLLASLQADTGKTVEIELAREKMTCEVHEVSAAAIRVSQIVRHGQGTGRL
ncbi:MAG: hypothetical protein JXR77_01600 [Lentisphaeria bacterium]|nr:hypothetical protein [Lentisphaeria bacterium]